MQDIIWARNHQAWKHVFITECIVPISLAAFAWTGCFLLCTFACAWLREVWQPSTKLHWSRQTNWPFGEQGWDLAYLPDPSPTSCSPHCPLAHWLIIPTLDAVHLLFAVSFWATGVYVGGGKRFTKSLENCFMYSKAGSKTPTGVHCKVTP